MCASAAGDVKTAKLMRRRSDETASNQWSATEHKMMGKFVVDGKLMVAKALRTAAAGDCGRTVGRLIAYEVLYVKYGVARWPVDALKSALAGKPCLY